MLVVSVFIYRIRFLAIVRILDLIFGLVYPKDWVQTRFEVCCAIVQWDATVWTYSRRSSSRGISGWTQRFRFIQSQTWVHSYVIRWRKSLESERWVDRFNSLFRFVSFYLCLISFCLYLIAFLLCLIKNPHVSILLLFELNRLWIRWETIQVTLYCKSFC